MNTSRRSKAYACDECKRRKVRCSGDATCLNCVRDGKPCVYGSSARQISALRDRLQHSEKLRHSIIQAWKVHLPHVDINEAIQGIEGGDHTPSSPKALTADESLRDLQDIPEVHQPDHSPQDFSNANDYEFDESQDIDNFLDGMGTLTIEPRKAGYMGAHSGIAALRLLQTLPLYFPIEGVRPSDPPEELNQVSSNTASAEQIAKYLSSYFTVFHPSYPILHEGVFRAKTTGALAKPKDGSWPILYNIVICIGAFVGDTGSSNSDIPFFQTARKHLSMEVLEKGSLSYVQALVLMATYLQKRNKPNAGFVLVGIGWSMSMAIGLHREFALPSTTPFNMELRRRTWWTVFLLVSEAQLTLGRPAASLVGITVALPSNVDDQDLAVDIDQLPEERKSPTTASCLIEQVKLQKIANMVQVELLTNQSPVLQTALKLNDRIEAWRQQLPWYFLHEETLEAWFDNPKWILMWRAMHLQIVLFRPILFQILTARSSLDPNHPPIEACLRAADKCVESICTFVGSGREINRGLAWFAIYWLITASFVHATCFLYNPEHELSAHWESTVQDAVKTLDKLGAVQDTGLRAKDMLQKLLDNASVIISPVFSTSNNDLLQQLGGPSRLGTDADFSSNLFSAGGEGHAFGDLWSSAMETDMQLPWYAQASSDAALLDAAGGIMLQGYIDSPRHNHHAAQ